LLLVKNFPFTQERQLEVEPPLQVKQELSQFLHKLASAYVLLGQLAAITQMLVAEFK
jgi:hypothetical protein